MPLIQLSRRTWFDDRGASIPSIRPSALIIRFTAKPVTFAQRAPTIPYSPFLPFRYRLHERKEVPCLAGVEIRIPRFQRIGSEDAQPFDDLFCPQQRAGAAGGDQVPVCDGGCGDIVALPL